MGRSAAALSSVAPAPKAQKEKKADRQSRRAEIIGRWERRQALRLFETERLGKRSSPDLVTDLLHYGNWVSFGELMVSEGLLEPGDHNTMRINRERAEIFPMLVIRLLRIIQLKEMPYDVYLQSPEWKQKAALAKERYGGRCALDETHEAHDAHHRTYERRGREYANDLIPLCRSCHERFHGK